MRDCRIIIIFRCHNLFHTLHSIFSSSPPHLYSSSVMQLTLEDNERTETGDTPGITSTLWAMDVNRVSRDTALALCRTHHRTHSPPSSHTPEKETPVAGVQGAWQRQVAGGCPGTHSAPSMIAVSTITGFPHTVSTSGSQHCPALPSTAQ